MQEETELMFFVLGSVGFCIATNQISHISNIDFSGNKTSHHYFHDLIDFSKGANLYTSPKLLLSRDDEFGIIINEPEDIRIVSILNFKHIPKIIQKSLKHSAFKAIYSEDQNRIYFLTDFLALKNL